MAEIKDFKFEVSPLRSLFPNLKPVMFQRIPFFDCSCDNCEEIVDLTVRTFMSEDEIEMSRAREKEQTCCRTCGE